ncbi:major facilitator superfamily domain protein [Artemisia annua]|uniref:Major facilitator superfamily domain protein n=1 Tax=Artemisia annua TaxID=35608 RepID=A0A2U1P314_ARTAN|nr:major facilitator superfamily domain protein [Artemisia annua]
MFMRNFVRGLASPMAGVLVLTYDRPTVLAMGTFCWAISTGLLGSSSYYGQLAFWQGVNGFGLAIVIPSVQSFIADSYSDSVRGTGFGTRNIYGITLSLIIINLAAIVERADENLLPSVYKEVSEAFNIGPSDLGYLMFMRNFVRGLASPMAGVLVLTYDRPTVLAMGTFCWAISTGLLGSSSYYGQLAFWQGVNGFGLAIVIPSVQSFIADSYSDSVRGTGFGFLNLVGKVGGISGGAVATVMAGHEFWGVPGWRCAFLLVSVLSCLIGGLVYLYVVDPKLPERNEQLDKGHYSGAGSVWAESWLAMKGVMKIKTFQIIVLQGLVGSLPWTSMVFFNMWFQLIGFDHQKVAILFSLFGAGCSIGSLIGGIIADRMSQIYPHSGRIICAQFSAMMGIPYTWFLLRATPQSVDNYHTYAVTLFLMGFTISWNGTACNAPMFAEVVPAKHRTMIYAFDRAMEGSFSSFAAPIVGILAEKVYGYNPKSVNPTAGSTGEALALSKALFSMMAVPFGMCSLFYTPLYWVFKHDRDSVRIATQKEEEMI